MKLLGGVILDISIHYTNGTPVMLSRSRARLSASRSALLPPCSNSVNKSSIIEYICGIYSILIYKSSIYRLVGPIPNYNDQ